jgi:hypothetical protein
MNHVGLRRPVTAGGDQGGKDDEFDRKLDDAVWRNAIGDPSDYPPDCDGREHNGGRERLVKPSAMPFTSFRKTT